MTLFFNGVLFLTDWYLHVTSQTSFSTSSRNQFSTAGLMHNVGRSEMHCSCPSSSKELLEKVASSVLERQNTYFKRQMPTSDFSEGQGTAFIGMRGCMWTLITVYCIIEDTYQMAVWKAKICGWMASKQYQSHYYNTSFATMHWARHATEWLPGCMHDYDPA